MSNSDLLDRDGEPLKVAIACQGGGSHTAFTAGVLDRLLSEIEPERFAGFSGASGGAACALMAWYGLQTGGPAQSKTLLGDFWDGVEARTLGEQWANDSLVNAWRMQDLGFWAPRPSPYDSMAGEWSQNFLRELLTENVNFGEIPSFEKPTGRLYVSAVDINDGEFRTFGNEEITADHVLASMAVPSLFPAVTLPAQTGDGLHYHWDGLFSQNPPIRNFLEEPDEVERKPDEIWIIQVDPQQRAGEPRRLSEIADRRDELSANLSLNQEVGFIEQVNEWVKREKLPDSEFKETMVRRIELVPSHRTEQAVEADERLDLSPASKLNRSPDYLRKLRTVGNERAGQFLEEVIPPQPA